MRDGWTVEMMAVDSVVLLVEKKAGWSAEMWAEWMACYLVATLVVSSVEMKVEMKA